MPLALGDGREVVRARSSTTSCRVPATTGQTSPTASGTCVLPKLVDAYRTGEDVAVEGADAVEAQGDFNRPWLVGSFATEYLPQVPDVHEKLTAGARVADVACGVGWAAISIARGYPATTVDGFDLDEPAVTLARSNAQAADVTDRVTFQARRS